MGMYESRIAECVRLVRDLHDGLGSSLTQLRLISGNMRNLNPDSPQLLQCYEQISDCT